MKIFLLVMAVSLTGCVTRTRNAIDVSTAYLKGYNDAERNRLQSIDNRLRRIEKRIEKNVELKDDFEKLAEEAAKETDMKLSYVCGICGKRFLSKNLKTLCTVYHGFSGCCHYGEIEIREGSAD